MLRVHDSELDWFEVGRSLSWSGEQRAVLRGFRPAAVEVADWYRGVIAGQAERVGPMVPRPKPGALIQGLAAAAGRGGKP